MSQGEPIAKQLLATFEEKRALRVVKVDEEIAKVDQSGVVVGSISRAFGS